MKVCRKCRVPKPLTDFHKLHSSVDGRQYACKFCSNLLAKAWASKHKQAHAQRFKEWATANRSRRKAYMKRWRANNKSKVYAHGKKWSAANPDKVRAVKRRWDLNHSDEKRERKHIRRAREQQATISPIPRSFFRQALLAWANRCAYCNARLDQCKREWDHFRPLARGGSHSAHNLIPACRGCNGSKYARDPFVFLHDLHLKSLTLVSAC